MADCDPGDLGEGHNRAITGHATVARHDTAADVTVVILATILDADDLESEAKILYEAARQSQAHRAVRREHDKEKRRRRERKGRDRADLHGAKSPGSAATTAS